MACTALRLAILAAFVDASSLLGGVEFRLGKREIGHLHAFGIVDIPFTVRIRDALIRCGRAERHHWLPNSGWTTVRVEGQRPDNAVKLLRLSYLRILMRSPDRRAASRASRELQSNGLEKDILNSLSSPGAMIDEPVSIPQ